MVAMLRWFESNGAITRFANLYRLKVKQKDRVITRFANSYRLKAEKDRLRLLCQALKRKILPN